MPHNKQFDYLIMIGDFAPFHIGCEQQLQEALGLSNQVIILVNNSHIPRNIENPWTYDDRYYMIKSVSDDRVIVKALFNYLYSKDNWIKQVQALVDDEVSESSKIGLYTNDDKLANMFPQWEHIKHNIVDEGETINIRTFMFEYKSILGISTLFSPNIIDLMKQFIETNEFQELVKEYDFIKKYKEAAKAGPYPYTYCTSDAVVVQSGHILMVVRGGFPGHNQLALPGGFLEQDETFVEGAIRELIEETRIDCPKKILVGNTVDTHIFDHPNRSLRGRTITQASFIKLPDGPLPKVKGSDDAKKAIWVPFSELDSTNIFEDHYSIINWFIGIK